MNRRIGRMLTLTLLILALPMGQGELQTSFSACDGGDCVSSSATYGADQEDTLKGTNIATFGGRVSLQQTFGGTGTSAEDSINATSVNGDKATAYYKITNPGEWNLDTFSINGNDLESAYAIVGFSASDADKIEAGASASSSAGPFARVDTVIDYGSVTDYVAWAQSGGFPDSPYAQADQMFSSASGDRILSTSESISGAYSANSTLDITNGSISGPGPSGEEGYTGSAKAYMDSANVWQEIFYGNGDKINLESRIEKQLSTTNTLVPPEEDKSFAVTRATLEGDAGAKAVFDYYESCAFFDPGNFHSWQQFGTVSGGRILTTGEASNPGKDQAGSILDVTKGTILAGPNGEPGYYNYADAYGDVSMDSSNVNQQLYYGVSNYDAAGKIDAGVRASNQEGDFAGSSAQLDNGSLGNFYYYAKASTSTSEVSRTINDALGDRIVFGAAAFNAMDSVKTRVTMEGVEGGPQASLGASEATARADATSAQVSNTVSNAGAANIVAGSGVNADSDPDAKTWDFQAASGVTVTQGYLDTSWTCSSFWANAYRNDDEFADIASTGMGFRASGDMIDAMAGSKNSMGQSSYAMTNILDGNVGTSGSNGMYASSAQAGPQFTGASNYLSDAMGRSIVSNVGSNIQPGFAQGGVGSGITVTNDIPVVVSGLTVGEDEEPEVIEPPIDDPPVPPVPPEPPAPPRPPVSLSSSGSTAANSDGSLGSNFDVSFASGGYISSGWRAANGEAGTSCLAANSGIDAYGATDAQAEFSGIHNAYYYPQGIFGGNSDIGQANGGMINFGGSVDNLRGDHADSGGSVISGYVQGLNLNSWASSRDVYSYINGGTLEGQQVDLGWMAWNSGGDTASGHTGAMGSPSEGWLANINSYSSGASANSLTVSGSESLNGYGSHIQTDWSAKSRDGETLGGSIAADSPDGYMASLSGYKGASANQRSVNAWQQGQGPFESGQSFHGSGPGS